MVFHMVGWDITSYLSRWSKHRRFCGLSAWSSRCSSSRQRQGAQIDVKGRVVLREIASWLSFKNPDEYIARNMVDDLSSLYVYVCVYIYIHIYIYMIYDIRNPMNTMVSCAASPSMPLQAQAILRGWASGESPACVLGNGNGTPGNMAVWW